MLQRAVSSSKPTQSKPNPHYSSPPSRNTAQQTIANAFVKRPANPTTRNDILGPSPTSAINYPAVGPTRPLTLSESSSSSLSRKRSLSQQGGLASVFNSRSAFQENVPPAFDSYHQPPKDSMAALHDAVYFDEADFDDDCDLDFDTTEPIIYPSLAAAAATLPTPPPQTDKSSPQSFAPPKPVQQDDYDDLEFAPRPLVNSRLQLQQHTNDPLGSSQPLPWSSSPAEHFEPPKPRAPVVEEEVVRPKRKKARALPWRAEKEIEIVVTKTTSRKVEARKISSGAMPWNDSFSNVEAGRKEARKRNTANQQKRSIATIAGDREDTKRAKKGSEPVAKIFLSDEQSRVIDLVMSSKQSVFFTGSAGTGKSVLLRELISELKMSHKKYSDAVAVTASTGLAACNIGGVTLHSFSGIGLGKEPVADLVKKIKKNQKARTRWIRTKILIMDEISMVDGELFDKLEAIARQIRNNGQPFGGIQLVVTGDFFQLPPVPDSGKVATFAFDAKTWHSCIAHTIGLTQVFRQRDPAFALMLNEMRLGKLSAETNVMFKSLSRAIEYDDGIQATELFSTRYEVDNANNQKLRSLPGEAMRFQAMDTGSITDENFRAKLLANCMAPKTIELKMHSQVMLIKNVDDSLVNGSLGRVVGFMSATTFDIMTENGEIDVASKQKKMPGAGDTAQLWPLVQFALMDGTSRQLLCQPEQWKIELPNGEVQAARNQIPLILAWALSIHKAQGQTLERVKVDLGRAFEKGQAYVALSRATCKEGLQVLGFDEKKVMAHEKVRMFYESLYSASEAEERGVAASSGLGKTK